MTLRDSEGARVSAMPNSPNTLRLNGNSGKSRLSCRQAGARVLSHAGCCFAAVVDVQVVAVAHVRATACTVQIKLNVQSVDREPFP